MSAILSRPECVNAKCLNFYIVVVVICFSEPISVLNVEIITFYRLMNAGGAGLFVKSYYFR